MTNNNEKEMIKMTKTLKQVTSFFLAIVVFVSVLSFSSLAADQCENVGGSGNCGSSSSFTAVTGKGWVKGHAITLTSTKGSFRLHYASAPEKVCNDYGYYQVTVRDTKTKKVTRYDWNGKKAIRIKLPDKKREYRITVTARDRSFIEQHRIISWGGFMGWLYAPSWNATRTANVTYCS